MNFDVKTNLKKVLSDLPSGVKLVAVSKYHPAEYIMAAYEEGQRIFGESHEQEIRQKVDVLPKDIEWHFIGHLQTNKVKYIAPYIDMIDAVDSMKLLREINKQAQKNNRIINVLLELHIAEEETKYGFSLDECRYMLAEGQWRELQNVRICGLMMMASYVDDPEVIRREMTLASATTITSPSSATPQWCVSAHLSSVPAFIDINNIKICFCLPEAYLLFSQSISFALRFIYKSHPGLYTNHNPNDIQIAERLRSNHSAIKHQWESDYIIITFFPLMI